jgi:hypothetical protein
MTVFCCTYEIDLLFRTDILLDRNASDNLLYIYIPILLARLDKLYIIILLF